MAERSNKLNLIAFWRYGRILSADGGLMFYFFRLAGSERQKPRWGLAW